MAVYSHSRLSTFEQCKLKYEYKYIDKIEVEVEESIEAFLGHVIHTALEYLYNTKIKENKTLNIDEVIIFFTETWQKEFKPNLLIVKNHLTDKDYFEMGIKFILDYYVKHAPFDEGTLETEKKILFPLDENKENYLIGFIDRFVRNKELNRYEIHDYKTGGSIPSKEKFESDRQLALYSYAIKKMFGFDKEVKLIWHYLAYNQEIQSSRTNDELEDLIKRIKNLIKEIEREKDFPYTKSKLCDWCEFKSICPAWQNENQSSPQNKINGDVEEFPTLKKYLKE